jgi:hypothetical protein
MAEPPMADRRWPKAERIIMVAIFCLRLGCGLIAALLLFPSAQINPRFYRVQFLTVLGLVAVAAVFLRDQADLALGLAITAAIILAFLGSIVWHVENSPGGLLLIWLSAGALAICLLLAGSATESDWTIADNLASAALLGSATTAMLMGHSYLIAPAMSLTPLYRLLGSLGICLLLRMVLAGIGLWLWTGELSFGNLETEMWLLLPARWGLGLAAPLVLGWMAWETARIRSTQSATGILYVVVIVCFLGELTSLLLREKTGFIL